MTQGYAGAVLVGSLVAVAEMIVAPSIRVDRSRVPEAAAAPSMA